mgnify:CR=1 FL=1
MTVISSLQLSWLYSKLFYSVHEQVLVVVWSTGGGWPVAPDGRFHEIPYEITIVETAITTMQIHGVISIMVTIIVRLSIFQAGNVQ